MLLKIKNWLFPPIAVEDQDKVHIIQALNLLIWAILLSSIALLVYDLARGVNVASSISVLGPAILLGMGLLAMVRKGHLSLTSWLLTSSLVVIITAAAMYGEGPHDSSIVAYPLIIVTAALTLGKRGLWVFTLVSFFAYLFLVYTAGRAPEIAAHTTVDTGVLATLFVIFLLTAFDLHLLINSQEKNLHQARQSEQKAVATLRELEALRNNLEHQVVERTQNAVQARQEAEAAQRAMAEKVWQTNGEAQLNNVMRGEQALTILATNVIGALCRYVDAAVGALFLVEQQELYLAGSYAYVPHDQLATRFKLGEGLVGQAAVERSPLTISDVPQNQLTIASGLGETIPQEILILPFSFDNQVIGVIEIGVLRPLSPIQKEFLHNAMLNVGIAFNTALARARIDELLIETQQQAEELQAQEEELRTANEELEAQTESLRASQAKLQQQQAQLETANAELEENAAALHEKQEILDQQNKALLTAQQELEQRAEELALASKYKSEFLANMSHELRTPLNSLLILARMLANNEQGNLTAEQVQSAEIIYTGGQDLLNLINEILDLSKIEAGKMDFHFEPVQLNDLITTLHMQFRHVADEKELEFAIIVEDGLPDTIRSDQQRLAQILKNLLSNAFKFTEEGEVQLTIAKASTEEATQIGLDQEGVIAFHVTDSGIGMTPDQQKIVFEGFQQADGSTSRKYGGTGLGLAISRELALNLGGGILLRSELGKGSTFTLCLPLNGAEVVEEAAQATTPSPTPSTRTETVVVKTAVTPPPPSTPAPTINDDRHALTADQKTLLIIEDDANFAQIVANFARKKGFQCLIATLAQQGLTLATAYHPDAIILDLTLPDLSGWDVLDQLKNDPDTRHIPVHIVSAADQDLRAFQMGALGFLTKPITPDGLNDIFSNIEQFILREIKTLLLVEDDRGSRHSINQLLGGNDIQITEASNGQKALALLQDNSYDCIILDLNLPDMSGFELLNHMNENPAIAKCPIIVYTGKSLTQEENEELMKYADSVIVKGVKSPERLLDETALFLHRVIAKLPAEKQRTIKRLHDKDALLSGRHILVVDDDMRNAFALSKLLGDKGLQVTIARSGAKALETLEENSGIDLVLMDIMMPGMDGYETMQRIRQQPQFRNLPILALTAKAMKGDAEKCMAAGANDYLTKPVDVDRLFSMLRVWLYT